MLLAALAWALGKAARRSNLGAAIGLGIFSHIVLDIIHHEPNITLLPMQWGPRLGMNLQGYPSLDFLVELAFCIVCWAIFRGRRALLVTIIVFNLINIPLMEHRNVLPTVILIQVLATWFFVWWFGRRTVTLEDAVPAPVT